MQTAERISYKDALTGQVSPGITEALEKFAAQDGRTPEQLAALGITVEFDPDGKKHITMQADPEVWLRDGRPRWVGCSSLSARVPRRDVQLWVRLWAKLKRALRRPGCRIAVRFVKSGPTGGWIPPHGRVTRWTCPYCRGALRPHTTQGGRSTS